MRRIAQIWALLPLLLLVAFPSFPQEAAGTDPLSFVGMTLTDLIGRFGTPAAVFAARGNEPWQDDVIFQYAGRDFYIYRDRVWQVKLVSAFGVSNGDTKTSALAVLGNMAQNRGDHALLPLTGANWPLMLRVNFYETGFVSAIYIYRSDF